MKLATDLPPPPKMDAAVIAEIRKESTRLVGAIRRRTESLELTGDDMRIRIR